MCHSYWITTWDGVPEQLSELRQYLHQTLGDEADGVDDVVLVVSELATNAIRHSASGEPGGSYELQVVSLSDAWHVRVEDQGSPNLPSPRDAEDGDEAGRGLPVVAALARAWGVIGDSNGRTVWAEIPYPADDVVAECYEGDVEDVRQEAVLSIAVRALTPDASDSGLRWEKAAGLHVVTDRTPA
jgi:anti-sigma regulatory factor (Ser/Thr protein kinase)